MAVSQANRGKSFEMAVELANQQYATKNWALIQKVPTPTKVIRRGKDIVGAFHEKKSTVDFIGLAQGKPIAFDAKSTRERTRFPLSNIEPHQMEFLEKFNQQGGMAFFLIHWEKHQETYRVSHSAMQRYFEEAEEGGRKSIPYGDMWKFQQVTTSRGIVLDYLDFIW